MEDENVLGDQTRNMDSDAVLSETRTQTTGLVGEKQRVLELAPAEERVARDLCQQGCHVVAVERDRATCTKLRRVCTEVVRGDIREVNLAQVLRGRKRFDAIVVGSLLQRSADPAALLARLLPYLDQRGSLVLTVDNAAHASVRLALLRSVTCRRPPVNRQMSHVSTVPNSTSPRSARSRRPAWVSNRWVILVPEK